jgi:GAF domain-containing protein
MSDPSVGEELAGVFARMSGLLLDESTVNSALDTVTALAVDTIAGSTGSGITLLDAAGRRITSAATDDLVRRLDGLQYDLDEGPCLSAWRERQVLRSGTESVRGRWPEWTRRAEGLGMASYVSAPLISRDDAIGAIKVYSTTDDAYDARDADLLRRFASQAAIFVANAVTVRAAEQLSERLKQTLRTRDVVAIARGIVMVRDGVDSEGAFRRLAEESQRSRRPLRDVAAQVVSSPTATWGSH